MYEVVNSKVASHRPGMEAFARLLRNLRQTRQLVQVDDSPYRDKALEDCFAESTRPNSRPISLVDRVLRLLLSDTKFRFSGLITFNERDFTDVCRVRRIQLFGHAI
jgi:hypothetical protein